MTIIPSLKSVLLDSNIIIYSINKASPKHKPAQQFILEQQSKLVIAQQNIFESLRVLTHPKFPNPMTTTEAIEAVSGITDGLVIIHPQFETKEIALTLIKKYELNADTVFDAYLFATMLSHEISTIATDNEKDFKKFKGIQIVNPFTET